MVPRFGQVPKNMSEIPVSINLDDMTVVSPCVLLRIVFAKNIHLPYLFNNDGSELFGWLGNGWAVFQHDVRWSHAPNNMCELLPKISFVQFSFSVSGHGKWLA
jgi:hypothetical protein